LAKAIGPEGQVIAFEPDSENYRKLLENVKLNELRNVRAFRKALGEKTAETKLYKGVDITDSTLIASHARKDIDYEVVEMVEGDSFREAEHLPIPRVIKIDVEGYEYAVLTGLRRTLAVPACQVVCCEVHPTLLPPDANPESILGFLKSLGFSRIDSDAASGYPLFHVIAYKEAPAAL